MSKVAQNKNNKSAPKTKNNKSTSKTKKTKSIPKIEEPAEKPKAEEAAAPALPPKLEETSIIKEEKTTEHKEEAVTPEKKKSSKSIKKTEKRIKKKSPLFIPDTQNKISITELKQECKELGIKGYSKKKKGELVLLLVDYVENKETDEDNKAKINRYLLLASTVKQLKTKCKLLRIRGYSKNKKIELVEAVDKRSKQMAIIRENISSEVDEEFTDEKNFNKITIESAYHFMLEKRSKDFVVTIEQFIELFKNDIGRIGFDISKAVVKRIRKKASEEFGEKAILISID